MYTGVMITFNDKFGQAISNNLKMNYKKEVTIQINWWTFYLESLGLLELPYMFFNCLWVPQWVQYSILKTLSLYGKLYVFLSVIEVYYSPCKYDISYLKKYNLKLFFIIMDFSYRLSSNNIYFSLKQELKWHGKNKYH